MSAKSVAAWLALLILTLICVLITAAFHPGHFNADAFNQLTQARIGIYNDWHPPVYAYFWRFAERLFPNSGILILLQIPIIFFAVFICFRKWFSVVAASVGTILVISSPWVLGYAGSLVKDVPYGTFALLFVGIALHAASIAKTKCRLACLCVVLGVLAALVVLVRYNGIVMAPFLLCFAATQIFALQKGGASEGHTRRWQAIGYSLLMTIVATCGVIGFLAYECRILRPVRCYPIQQVLYYDVTGISIEKGDVLLSESLFPHQDLAIMKTIFWPGGAMNLIQEFTNNPEAYPMIFDDASIKQLRSDWLRAVIRNPLAYLKVRWQCYLACMQSRYAYHPGVDQNDMGVQITNPALHNLLLKYLSWADTTVLYSLWLWKSVCIVLFVGLLAYYLKSGGAHYYLIPLIPLANHFSLFLSTPASDYRLSWITPLFATTGAVISIMLVGRYFWMHKQSAVRTGAKQV